jgi:hypothetical protein
VAAVLALPRLRRSAAARYTLAASAVLLAALLPPGAALLARALPPFQLWRIPWFAPFGIATAMLSAQVVGWARRDGRLATRSRMGAALQLLCLVAVVATVPSRTPDPALPARAWGSVLSIKRSPQAVCRPRYDELAALGAALDRGIDGQAIAIGDAALNDLLPTVSPRVRVVVFRTPFDMRDAHALPRADVQRRVRLWQRAVASDTPPDERLRLLDELGAGFLAVCDEPAWVASLRGAAPDRIHLMTRAGRLHLYRIGAGLGPSRRS